jgi:hypothetical protein
MKSHNNQTNEIEKGVKPTRSSYLADIYKFDIDTKNSIVNLTINNVISWEWLRMRLTKSELKGLADFIYNYLEKNND